MDFGLRCARLKMAGEYVPGAVARHRGNAALGRWHPEMVRLMSRNQVLLIARHWSGRMILSTARNTVAAHGLFFLLAIRHGAGGAWLRGRMQGWAMFGRARGSGFDPALPELLRENDRLIRELQSASGFDTFWRGYFLLAGH